MTNTDNAPGSFDAEAAFLKSWGIEDAELSSPGREEPHDETEDDEVEDAELSDAEETEEDVDNEAEDDVEADDDEDLSEAERKTFDDDDVVTVKIDGEDVDVSLRDLKRQYGQHRANDLRSKEIVREKQVIAQQSQATRIAAETLYNRALEKAQVWDKVDFAEILDVHGHAVYNSLKADAEAAFADVRFFEDGLRHEIARHEASEQHRRAAEMQAREQRVQAELSNPETGIAGFGHEMLQSWGDYARKNGVSDDTIPNLFEPSILRLLHKAKLYDEMQAVTAKAKPLPKTPSKIVKATASSETSRRVSKSGSGDALQKLKRSGSAEDAESAFLAMWQDD